jgi:ubiquinone/menaquinone biosynthesis C-methylase UbiE
MVDSIGNKDIKDDYKSIWKNKTLEKISTFKFRPDGVYEDFISDGCCPFYDDDVWEKHFTNWFNWQLNDKLKVEEPLVTLDIGSHTGKWTTFLASVSEKVICADVYKESEDIIRMRFEDILKSNNKELEFKLINGNNLDVFDDESVGLVWSVDSFTRLSTDEITTYVQDISRILKPGGLALLHIPRHDMIQQSGAASLPFPKFDIFHMNTILSKNKNVIRKLGITINYSNAYTIRRMPAPGPYLKPFKFIHGCEMSVNMMIYESFAGTWVELPGVGQFMMIEKSKIK